MGYVKKKIRGLRHFYYRNRKDLPPPYEPLQRIVAACQEIEEKEQLIYFGDSVIERISRDDVDKTPLGQMVANKLQLRYTTRVISHSGYNPGIYLALSHALKRAQKKPAIVLLPINIRCFSPQWDWNPEFDFEREITAINHYHRNPDQKMIRLLPTSKIPVGFWRRQAFLHRRIRYPFTAHKRIKHFMSEIAYKPQDPNDRDFRWRQIFIFHYLYPLQDHHRQIRHLQALYSFLHGLGIPVVSYLTPINYKAGVRYVGEVFKEMVSENVRKILQQIAAKPLPKDPETIHRSPMLTLANWTFLLTEEFFFHRDEPTEHLNESGRNKLSEEIVRLVCGGKTGTEA